MNTKHVDVIIVGAGIAGSALAAALARAGVQVVVLERSQEYVDRVRGEFMHLWGVAEAQRLGVYDALVSAGGNTLTRIVGYDEAFSREEAEAGARPLDGLVPGVPGALSIGHPTACRALETAAAVGGAQVIHGVEDVEVSAGMSPCVRYHVDATEEHLECRIVVGADGRESVVRRTLGMGLRRTDARILLAGLLVDGLRDWPQGDAVIGTEGDSMLYVFPQGDGKARLYLGVRAEDSARLAGRQKTTPFLASFRVKAIPDSQRLADANPAGPCAVYPMFDTWTDDPTAEGAVVIGDAAGFSDPTIGQGLSVALRDARMVADVMLSSDDWSPSSFRVYAEERSERMRRLRACAQAFTYAHIPMGGDSVAERRRRLELLHGGDPDLSKLVAAMACGAERAPVPCFSGSGRDHLLAPGQLMPA